MITFIHTVVNVISYSVVFGFIGLSVYAQFFDNSHPSHIYFTPDEMKGMK